MIANWKFSNFATRKNRGLHTIDSRFLRMNTSAKSNMKWHHSRDLDYYSMESEPIRSTSALSPAELTQHVLYNDQR